MPVAWQCRHRAGGDLCSSFSLVAASFKVPQMTTILRRGVAWAAR